MTGDKDIRRKPEDVEDDRDRKLAVLKKMLAVNPDRSQLRNMHEDGMADLFLEAMSGRASHYERALPIAINRSEFPPTIATLASIIEEEDYVQQDMDLFTTHNFNEYIHREPPREFVQAWLDDREKQKTKFK